MLKEPIVARKSRNRFIISAVKDTDPVQLVRQLNDKELEVHLKNGTTYIEKVTPDELDLVILELMGYREETLVLSFNAWPERQVGFIDFEIDEENKEWIGNAMLNYIFENTPFLKSKFISLDVYAFDEVKDFYDDKYGLYEVEVALTFWCRADMPKEIVKHIEAEGKYDFTAPICGAVRPENDRVCRNDIDITFIRQD
jgi:hypothetical protein